MINGAHVILYSRDAEADRAFDVEATVKELTAKDVEFTQPVTDEGWGLLTRLRLPGGGEIGMYEPRHERATDR
jgi:hypothetical protein